MIPALGRSPGEGSGSSFQYSSWEMPWSEEPGGLQCMGWQRVGHDLASKQQQQNRGMLLLGHMTEFFFVHFKQFLLSFSDILMLMC